MIYKTLIVAAALVLAGCATGPRVSSIEPSGQVAQLPDISSASASGNAPYEIKHADLLSVAVNVSTQSGLWGATRVSVFFKSNSDQELTVAPSIRLLDANGIELPAYSYEGFMQDAAALAGSPHVPMPQFKPYASSATTQGTIRNTQTGQTYTYQAQTTSQPGPFSNAVDGYAQGVAFRMAKDAADKRNLGQGAMRWAPVFWLRESYKVAPKTAVSGVVVYPFAFDKSRLPAKVIVEIAGKPFEFVVGAK